MKPISKARYMGVILLLLSANFGYSQWSDGPFLSLAGQVGMPINKEIKAYKWGAGGVGKFALPLGASDYCTVSMNAISINGSYNGKGLKERDVLSGMMGYRYDFRKEDTYSYFYMEPQIGWAFVGTDYNSFCYMPAVGYSLNGKVDFSAFYYTTTANPMMAKISVAGVMVAYNLHFARKLSD
ncbi:hypothetical protein D3H65_10755 [Paraflavitalea soli]|uniref:Outer membrane protein beta-barrel domain-containing protein n=1 Tax=Paraflavitalea soli TaxID=2315862 RepID=A0A3B7ML72_9BACT|nr:hypothetical protein [Paraflavitalea soli]AXY74427.1 hypothetical protein D3H65_10755 [Paraflavitalea soli]